MLRINRFITRKVKRAITKKVYGIFMIMLLTGCAGTPFLKDVSLNSFKETVANNELITEVKGNLANFTGGNFSELPKNEKIQVSFSKHVDGDTARFKLNNHEFKSRFLLVDTPETVKRGVDPQPFGKEASDRTHEILETAQIIEIMFDNGDRTDHYNRALCYVYVDGVLLQNILVSEGLARVAYVSEPNTSKLAEIKENERLARTENNGIWSIPNYVTEKGFNP